MVQKRRIIKKLITFVSKFLKSKHLQPLISDQQNGSQVYDDRQNANGEAWMENGRNADFRYTTTPPDGRFPMQNGGHVKFEVPKVPVIFVLGGPGSGKVTHGDSLMQEKRGITHINMTDLLQQYAIGNGE